MSQEQTLSLRATWLLPTPKALQEGCCSQKAWLDPSVKEPAPQTLMGIHLSRRSTAPSYTHPVITI